MLARQEILLDTYAKTIAIEASLMLDMSRTQILPVALQEQAAAADLVLKTRAVSTEAAMEEERFTCLRGHTVGLNGALAALEQQLAALRPPVSPVTAWSLPCRPAANTATPLSACSMPPSGRCPPMRRCSGCTDPRTGLFVSPGRA